MSRAGYFPLDVACPHCDVLPGQRCRSTVISGRPVLARPHSGRVTAAREAEARRSMPKLPATVSHAWTCPECGRSYWPPAEWETELWPAVRHAAQLLHGRRHGRLPAAAGHPRPPEM